MFKSTSNPIKKNEESWSILTQRIIAVLELQSLADGCLVEIN